ncbi:sugar phosphate isomerase/epimerase family protein [Labedaea rhizosphaerae]|uniref:Sugar phosphate isomerase/epimerase n=1 Tax=Labedaea rhizosphaerae TaxID=598644 RepID=A0A4R6S2B0_LABRH|nr:sugar phosphate isomerase/epimerase [Labedaea rhizosphaerae]TDP92795.1 sugar phosphate isomerase/epimerase [Labedaea rhizosphaerae]
MSLLRPRELTIGYLQLTGAAWDQPPRHPLGERLAALAAAGFSGTGMDTEDLERIQTTHGADWVRGQFAEHGLRLVELEMVTGWETADDHTGPLRAREDRAFELAEAYGVRKVKAFALAVPGVRLAPVEVLAKRFGALCDRAAGHGVDIALECLSFMPGFNHAGVVEVLRLADRPNATVQVDMWHVFRDPTALPALDQLSGAQIGGVELCDGPLAPPPDLLAEAVDGRLLPGHGEWDVLGLLRRLDAKGVDVPLSTEVLSTSMRALPPAENAARTMAALREFLAAG